MKYKSSDQEGKEALEKGKKIVMSKKSFKREHKHLVKVLRKGSKKQRVKEAKKQSKEL